MGATEYYAVNDRPVKVVEFEDGSADIFVYEWSTGGFVPDRSYWEHIHGGNAFKDVDQLTTEQFTLLVDQLRTQAVRKHLRTPIRWERAEGPNIHLRAELTGHTFTIRMNNLPTNPTFTLIIDGEEIADLTDWPSVWILPETHTYPLNK